MRPRTLRAATAATASLLTLALGCGTTGWIRFQQIDPSAEAIHQTPTQVYAIDCKDDVIIRPEQRPELLHVATCTKDGANIPWKVLGAYPAAEIAFKNWDKYTREVVEKAKGRGCPAVLVRRTPPAHSSEAVTMGALCVDTAESSGVEGPLRLASVGTEPLRVLGAVDPQPLGLPASN
jgi:hypothetical protein